MSAWTDQIWGAVERNGVARRDCRDVAKYGGSWWNDGFTELVEAAKRRKYHVVKMGTQFVVFKDPIEVMC